MTLAPTDIRIALEIRGVQLGTPADEESLQKLERDFAISLDPYYRTLYSKFNGFRSLDDRSLIFLWPLERIIEHKDLSVQEDRKRYFAIGDILIDSEFIMCCLEQAFEPMFLLYEKRRLVPTSIFLERLAFGEFDLSHDEKS
jgi:hypothetical protein